MGAFSSLYASDLFMSLCSLASQNWALCVFTVLLAFAGPSFKQPSHTDNPPGSAPRWPVGWLNPERTYWFPRLNPVNSKWRSIHVLIGKEHTGRGTEGRIAITLLLKNFIAQFKLPAYVLGLKVSSLLVFFSPPNMFILSFHRHGNKT